MGALPVCQCQGQGKHLPLVETSLSNHFPLSVTSVGLLFIFVSCNDNIIWRLLWTRQYGPYPEALLGTPSQTGTPRTGQHVLWPTAYGTEVPPSCSWKVNQSCTMIKLYHQVHLCPPPVAGSDHTHVLVWWPALDGPLAMKKANTFHSN